MSLNPQAFFSFAAKQYGLLKDLFYRSSGITDADLRELIIRNRNDNDPAPDHLADQLVKLRIIEPSPDATAHYEITSPVKNLMRFLLQEQRLTSATVIQAYLNDLEQSQRELDGAIRESRPVWIERALNEINETLERIRQDSRANREAVINEVMSVKSNKDQRSVRERFEIINRLWTRYLEPLRDLIDVRKSMDAAMDGLERVMRSGAHTFDLDGGLNREFHRSRTRLTRLRREISIDFHESLREVEPLYESLKQDSELVRGASRALERIGKEGLKNLGFSALLAIPSSRQQEGLFPDLALESYLHGVYGYEPEAAPALPSPENQPIIAYVKPEEVIERLAADLPIQDVLKWIMANYDQLPLSEVLRVYARIYQTELGKYNFAEMEQSYPLQGATLYAHPMAIEVSP